MASRRALFGTIGLGVALLVLNSCAGRESTPYGVLSQVTSVTEITPGATRESSYPAFTPEVSGYPELLSATAEPTLKPTPTSTGIPAPTAGPTVMISYSLDSVDDWKIYVDDDYGFRFRYPPDSSFQSWDNDVIQPTGREISIAIGVSEDGSGVLDRSLWVYLNAYRLRMGQSLEAFQEEIGPNYGQYDDGPPQGGYPSYAPVLGEIREQLAQIANGGARLQYGIDFPQAGYFMKHGDNAYVVTFGVDMMTNPSDSDAKVFKVIMSTFEFTR